MLAIYFRATAYDIVHPRKGPITEAIYGLGKVKSSHRFDVIIGVVSTVEKLYVEEGQQVKKNDPLIKLEAGTAFRAPFDGTVTLVSVRDGETALPHVALLRVEDLRDRYIELTLEQQAALRLKSGQKARVSFETLRGTILDGEVTSVYSRQDEFLARVTVNGLEPQVLPGMTADVTVEVGTIHQATLVPLKALHNGMLTIKKDGAWKNLKVEVGHVDGAFAEIKGDLIGESNEIRMRKGN